MSQPDLAMSRPYHLLQEVMKWIFSCMHSFQKTCTSAMRHVGLVGSLGHSISRFLTST